MIKKFLVVMLLSAVTVQAAEPMVYAKGQIPLPAGHSGCVPVSELIGTLVKFNRDYERGLDFMKTSEWTTFLPRCYIQAMKRANDTEMKALNDAFIKSYKKYFESDQNGFLKAKDMNLFYNKYQYFPAGQVFIALGSWTEKQRAILQGAIPQASEKVSVIDRLIQTLNDNNRLDFLEELYPDEIDELDSATREKMEELKQAFIKLYHLDLDEDGFVRSPYISQHNSKFYHGCMRTLTGQVFRFLSTWTKNGKSKEEKTY